MAIESVKLFSTRMTKSPAKREGEKVYKVLVTSDADDAGTAIEATDGTTTIPARGEEWSATLPVLRCTNVDADMDAAPEWRLWIVRARFETGDVADEIENPLDELAIVEWSELVSVEPVYRDRNGVLICNSAGQTFDPPVQKDIFDMQFTVTRNILTRDPAMLEQYLGSVNSSSFQIRGRNGVLRTISTGAAKLVSWRVVDADRNGFSYQQESIMVACRGPHDGVTGWTRNLLDHGYIQIVTDELDVVVDQKNIPLNTPVNLNGAGVALAPGADPEWLPFNLEPEEDFNDLDFPT